jgi:chaperonin cofactor prefoldin
MEKVLNEILVKLLSIDNKVSDLDNKVSTLDNKVSTLDNKVSTLDHKVSNLDNKVSELDNKFFNLDNKVTNLEVGQQQIVTRLDTLETDVKEVRDTVNRIEVSQNDDVIALLKMMHKQKH